MAASDARSSLETIGRVRFSGCVGSGITPPRAVPTPMTKIGMPRARAALIDSSTAPLHACPSESSTSSWPFMDAPLICSSFWITRSPQVMPSAIFVSHVVMSSRRNGGPAVRWSRKKKKVFGSLVSRICGAAMCANSVSATRSCCQLNESPSTRRNVKDRCHRSVVTSATCIDADPSSTIMRSTPPVRTSDATTRGCASAPTSSPVATIVLSQNSASPMSGNRS